MGVEGLWKILNSTKENVTLESLNGKILAVDLSIWIYQALRSGGASKSRNAHLKILFFRICKLLFYGVKPIFVFDGPNVPYFKQMTLSKRRLRKAQNVLETSKIQKKILKKLSQMVAKGKLPVVENLPPPSPQKLVNLEKIEFSDQEFFTDSDDDSEVVQFSDSKIERQNLPEDSNDFCDFQLQNLLAKNQATKKLQKNIDEDSIDIVLPKNFLKIKNAYYGVDRHHFLLEIKTPNDEKIDKSTTSRDQDNLEICEPDLHSKSIDFKDANQKIDKTMTPRDRDNLEIDKPDFHHKSIDFEDDIKSVVKDQTSCDRKLDNDHGNKSIDFDLTSRKIDNQSSHDRSVDIYGQKINIQSRDYDQDQIFDNSDRMKSIVEVQSSPDQKLRSHQGNKFIDFDLTFRKINNQSSADLSIDIDHQNINIKSRDFDQDQKIDNQSSYDQSIDIDGQKITIEPRDFDLDQKIDNVYRIKSIVGDQTSRDFGRDQKIDNQSSRDRSTDFDSRKDQKIDNKWSRDLSIDIGRQKINIESRDFDYDQKIDISDRVKSIVGDQISLTFDQDQKIDNQSSHDRSINHDRQKIDIKSRDFDQDEKIDDQSSRDRSNDIDGQKINIESRDFDQDQKIDKSIDQFSSDDDDSFVEVVTDEETPTTSDKNDLKQKLESEEKSSSMTSQIPEMTLGEAESECARLELLELCQGTVTDDSDVWLFGAKNVYRHVFDRKKYVEKYSSSKIYEKLGLTREKMIKLAMLTGCDYTEGLKGVGSITGLEILSEFGQNHDDDTKIDDLKEFRLWYENNKNSKSIDNNPLRRRLLNLDLKFPDSFPDQSIMDEFLTPKKIDNQDPIKIDNFQKLTNHDEARLKKYAAENLDFNLEKINLILKPAIECKVVKNTFSVYTEADFTTHKRDITSAFSLNIECKVVKNTFSVYTEADFTTHKRDITSAFSLNIQCKIVQNMRITPYFLHKKCKLTHLNVRERLADQIGGAPIDGHDQRVGYTAAALFEQFVGGEGYHEKDDENDGSVGGPLVATTLE
uniref:Uncharacterized protein n=1 Tax=Romanomermis culicivorax TaxID=13658 RepID=A0A915LBH9_ROMCU